MTSAEDLVNLQQTLYSSKNPTRGWLHCSRRDWIIDAIHANAAATQVGMALEIGPGSGIYLPALAQRFQDVVASDIEEAYLDNARPIAQAYPNISFAKDDITATQLPRGSFDLILCTEVVEHIRDSRTAVAQIHSLLKPGGKLILSTPQRYSPLELSAKIAFLPGIIDLVRLVYREPILQTGHINLMTEQTMRSQIVAAGFEIQKTYKSGLYIPLIAETLGKFGLRLEQTLEQRLRGSRIDWLLWTQYYIARA